MSTLFNILNRYVTYYMFSVSPTTSVYKPDDRTEPEKIRIWREQQVKRLQEKGE